MSTVPMNTESPAQPHTGPLLEAKNLVAGYGGVPAVRDLNLHVNPGEVVALLGPNGAGKTTTLLTLCGELAPISGDVTFLGNPDRMSLSQRARQGLAMVTEERSVFMDLTTAENLRLGRGDPDRALQMFPLLRDHLNRKAGLLSGGQQQILTLARALASEPRVLLADELSLGLAPIIVIELFDAIRRAADEFGVGVLLVEQHVRNALHVADRIYVLQRGRCVLSGRADHMAGRLDEIESTYLAGPVETHD
jgi:ABC-type branched-subunit amino acid transport system ATPase component